MSHQVISRKYRPQRFDELVGQQHVARIFQNALASGRVGHAYLLVGPRGVGKTTTARIVARALNCDAARELEERSDDAAAIEPCGVCPSCVDIARGSDLDVVEMDAASNNAVDDVRALREQVGYATVRSRYRIWIVDEVHMLSLPAFNAFLKTLEEPPAQVKFLFCTTEEHKLPDTFRSRCQRVEFRPIAEVAMAERIAALAAEEGVVLAEGVALAIARGALGGLRDAESQLEQLIAARGPGDARIELADLDALSGRAPAELLATLLAATERRDAGAALDAVDACLAAGSKPGVLLDQWLEALRAQLVAAVRDEGAAWARAARAIDVLLGKRIHLRSGADGALVAQVAAVELARLPDARDLDALVEALRGGASGSPAGTPGPPGPRGAAAAAPPPRAPAPAPAPRAPSRGQQPPMAFAPTVGSAVPAAVGEADPRGVTLGVIHAGWEEIVKRARLRNPVLGRVLAATQVRGVEGDALQLVVTDGDEQARGTLRRREVHLVIGQITQEVVGTWMQVALQDAVPMRAAHAATGVDLRGHPDVVRVTEATGGRLLDVERRAAPEHGAEGARRGGA